MIIFDAPTSLFDLVPNKDFVYCSTYRYLASDEYKEKINSLPKNIKIILGDDNGLVKSKYLEIIKEIKPAYYFLPYTGFEEDNILFASCVPEATTPIVTPVGRNVYEVVSSIRQISQLLPKDVPFLIPSYMEIFGNEQEDVGYFTQKDIPYKPLRTAVNRKLFLKDIASTMKQLGRRVILFGCNSLTEFEDWGSNFDKSFIKGLITDHPIAFTLENPCNHYNWGFFRDNDVLMPMKSYCPEIRNYEDLKVESLPTDQVLSLGDNVKYFIKIVEHWYDN